MRLLEILRSIKTEISSLIKAFVVAYPDSYVGACLRKAYWSSYLNLDKSKFRRIGRGAVFDTKDTLVIGSNFVFGDNALLDNGDSFGCYIGNYVGIANGSYIRTGNHSMADVTVPIIDQGHTAKSITYKDACYSVVIEDDVWIGAFAIILSGAHIGEGSVVSAGSVISSYVPPYSIVAGNPARVIANRKKIAEHKI